MNRHKSLCNFFNILLVFVAGHFFVSILNLVFEVPWIEEYVNFLLKNNLIIFTFDLLIIIALMILYIRFINTIKQNLWKKESILLIFKFDNCKKVLKVLCLTFVFWSWKISKYYFAFENDLTYAWGLVFNKMFFTSVSLILCIIFILIIIYLVLVTWTYKKIQRMNTLKSKLIFKETKIKIDFCNMISPTIVNWVLIDFEKTMQQILTTVKETRCRCYRVKNSKITLVKTISNIPPDFLV